MATSIGGRAVRFLGGSWEIPESACLILGLPIIGHDAPHGPPPDLRRGRPARGGGRRLRGVRAAWQRRAAAGDDALRGRGIETDRYPRAEFRLTEPVDLSRRTTATRGELNLHGETQPIRVRLSAQRLQDSVELAGSARIAFADFGIGPPSVAGGVTVEDQGMLEFKLRLTPAG